MLMLQEAANYRLCTLDLPCLPRSHSLPPHQSPQLQAAVVNPDSPTSILLNLVSRRRHVLFES